MAGKLRLRARGRVRRQPGTMNKTEAAYADILEAERIAGRIHSWHYERVTFKLADDCRYTPDFQVVYPDGLVEYHEVKGFWEDDALAKIKVAATSFPEFTFRAFHKKSGQWHEREFKPL